MHRPVLFHSFPSSMRHYSPYPHPNPTPWLPQRLLELPETMCQVRWDENWAVVAARLHVFLYLTQMLYNRGRRGLDARFTFTTDDILRELGCGPSHVSVYMQLAPAYNEALLSLHGPLLHIVNPDLYRNPITGSGKAVNMTCTAICLPNEMPFYRVRDGAKRYPAAHRLLLSLWPILRRSNANWWRRIDIGRYRQLLRYGRTHALPPLDVLRALHIWLLLSTRMWDMRSPPNDVGAEQHLMPMGAMSLRHIQRKTRECHTLAQLQRAFAIIQCSHAMCLYPRTLPVLRVHYGHRGVIDLPHAPVIAYMYVPCPAAVPKLLQTLCALCEQRATGDHFLLGNVDTSTTS